LDWKFGWIKTFRFQKEGWGELLFPLDLPKKGFLGLDSTLDFTTIKNPGYFGNLIPDLPEFGMEGSLVRNLGRAISTKT